MGLSYVGGICYGPFSCVIAELGTTKSGQPYPSTGYASCLVAGHEMAHNFGASHDA